MENNEDGYDGSRLRYHEMWTLLEMEYERQMWDCWKKQHPDGFPWDKVIKFKDEQIVGKMIISSTVDLNDSGSDFRKLWNQSAKEESKTNTGLYRIFASAFENLKDKEDEATGGK